MIRLVREHRIGITIAALVALFFIFRDELPDFDLEELIEDLSGSLGGWTYLLVGGLAFLETGAFVGLVAPGEFTVILGGAVAGQGDISLALILGIAWFSAAAGDTVSFFLGRRLGREFLRRHGERVRITDERLQQVDGYFARHGGKTILVGRFIGLVRALAPFIAGSSGMRYGAFVPYSILGTGLWATGLILVGYFASQSLDTAAEIVGQGLLLFGITVGVIVTIVVGIRHLRVAENRRRIVAGMERRPHLRPPLALARRLRPQARFVWQRLTPGGLGLELTTLLAVLSVGLYFLIAYTWIINGDPATTAGDETAIDVVDHIREVWLTDVAEAITKLGAAHVTVAIAVLAAVALAAGRRWGELSVLVIGMALIVGVTHELKVAIDRPRPAGGLVDVTGSSFPSAHASYSTIYAWLAITVAWRIAPGLTARTAVIAAGIAVTAVVGLTRVYLGVHYLSDVMAGWALGVSAFAATAAVALVASHIRQNAATDARPRGESA